MGHGRSEELYFGDTWASTPHPVLVSSWWTPAASGVAIAGLRITDDQLRRIALYAGYALTPADESDERTLHAELQADTDRWRAQLPHDKPDEGTPDPWAA